MTYTVIYYFDNADSFVDTYTTQDVPYTIKARPGYDYTDYSLNDEFDGQVYSSGATIPAGDYVFYEYPDSSGFFPSEEDDIERIIHINFISEGNVSNMPITPPTFEHRIDQNPFSYEIPGIEPQREGYMFNGWKCSLNNQIYCDILGGFNIFSANIDDNITITFTAEWVKITQYTIKFISNTVLNPEYLPEDIKMGAIPLLPSHLTFPKRIPRKLNSAYIFSGWAIKRNNQYTGEICSPGTVIEIYGTEEANDETIIIEACWDAVHSKVIYYDFYNYQNWSIGENPYDTYLTTIPCTDSQTPPIQPTKIKNCEFLFWGIENSCRLQDRITTVLPYDENSTRDQVIKVFGIWSGSQGYEIDYYSYQLYDTKGNRLYSYHPTVNLYNIDDDNAIYLYEYFYLPSQDSLGNKIKSWKQKETDIEIPVNTLMLYDGLESVDEDNSTLINLVAVMNGSSYYYKTAAGWIPCTIQQKTNKGWKNADLITKTDKGWQ